MRKIVVLLAFMAVLVPTSAMAATGSDDATLTVTVNDTITVVFSDDTADFGSVNAGVGIVEQLDTLAYTVSSNVATGFSLDVSALDSVGSGAPAFAIRRGTDDLGGYTPLPAGPDSVANDWVTESTNGTFNYTDDARVNVDAGSASGTHTRTLRYLATTN